MRRLSQTTEPNLRSPVLLRACDDFSTRVSPARVPVLHRLAIHPGFRAIDISTGHPRRRARPLLETLFLDSIPASPAVPPGHHTGRHGLSFPPGSRTAYCLNRTPTKPTSTQQIIDKIRSNTDGRQDQQGE